MFYWDYFMFKKVPLKFPLVYFNSNIIEEYQKARIYCSELIAGPTTHVHTHTHTYTMLDFNDWQCLIALRDGITEFTCRAEDSLVHHRPKSISELCCLRQLLL